MGRKYKTKHAWQIHDVVQLRCEGYTYREIIYMVSIDVWFNSLALRESDIILNIGPGHVWVPSGNKSLPEPVVTGVRVTIPGPQWVNGFPMITYYPPMDQWLEIIKTNMWIWVYIYTYTHIHTYEPFLLVTRHVFLTTMNLSEDVDVLELNFGKMFDIVGHKRLHQKQNHYGINGELHFLIQSFPFARTQLVPSWGLPLPWGVLGCYQRSHIYASMSLDYANSFSKSKVK